MTLEFVRNLTGPRISSNLSKSNPKQAPQTRPEETIPYITKMLSTATSKTLLDIISTKQ